VRRFGKANVTTGFFFYKIIKEGIPFPSRALILRRVIYTIAEELYRHTSADS
jgi:hypothetical protein